MNELQKISELMDKIATLEKMCARYKEKLSVIDSVQKRTDVAVETALGTIMRLQKEIAARDKTILSLRDKQQADSYKWSERLRQATTQPKKQQERKARAKIRNTVFVVVDK